MTGKYILKLVTFVTLLFTCSLHSKQTIENEKSEDHFWTVSELETVFHLLHDKSKSDYSHFDAGGLDISTRLPAHV